MLNEFKVIIDGTSMEFFTKFDWSYEWIVDAYRNDDDFMIISNPVKKRKITLSAAKLTKLQFRTLMSKLGENDITHTVQLYDDLTETVKSYAMYNSTVQGSKRQVGGQVLYEGVSFSLIER